MADASLATATNWPIPHTFPASTEVCLDLDLGHDDQEATEDKGPPWNALPPELLAKIFSLLEAPDKESVEGTCVAWREACQDPALWHSQVYFLDGDNCIQVVHQACRTIQRKGYLLRHLTLRIGLPSLAQAWMLSQCVQQLLEVISAHPEARQLHSLTVTKLNFFTRWRFFTLSKRNILLALNNFLLQQSHLREVNLATCRLSADDGMRILKALTISRSRHTLRRLNLHNFFQRKYNATFGGRFRHLLTSSFSRLRHLAVDARHMEPDLLLALVSRPQPPPSAARRRYPRHVTVHFETSPPRHILSDSCWATARQRDPDLEVTFVFQGRMPVNWAKKIMAPSVPLTDLVMYWPRAYHHHIPTHQHLAEVLERVSQIYPAVLERFNLHSDIRAIPEVELSLIRMANDCRRLAEFKVTLKLTSNVVHEISQALMQRSHPVHFRLVKRKKSGQSKSLCRTRSRSAGMH